ncbi:MAG: Lrp/AsnC family transcriptional regulator [Candidatus Bathyarchaeota archaeon]|nr:Lrp/AsnC family transcriptional regulator [Candidatus Bathyarchaeota archaeon]
MQPKLDEKDIRILRGLQENCKITTKQIAKEINSPITTVFAKIKRMEKLGMIKAYKAVLDARKLDRGTTAFILASFSYGPQEAQEPLSQRRLAEQISKLPEVQEVHIITGDWDILMKVKDKNVDAIGKFVIDKLRTVKGIQKTLTCMVFHTEKESSTIMLETPTKTRW